MHVDISEFLPDFSTNLLYANCILITLVGVEKVVEISDVLKDIWNYCWFL